MTPGYGSGDRRCCAAGIGRQSMSRPVRTRRAARSSGSARPSPCIRRGEAWIRPLRGGAPSGRRIHRPVVAPTAEPPSGRRIHRPVVARPRSAGPAVTRRSRRVSGGFAGARVGRVWNAPAGQCEQLRGCTRVVGGAEAGAAAATGDRIRVVHGEARAHQGIDVVDLAPHEQRHAVAVDVDLDAVRLEDLVVGRGRVLEHHPVAISGAAAGVHVDAQADLGARLVLRELLQLDSRGVGQRQDGGLGTRSSVGVLLGTGCRVEVRRTTSDGRVNRMQCNEFRQAVCRYRRVSPA